MLSGRGLCDELITRPEESYRLCCVVACDLETSRMGAPYIYDISRLRVKLLLLLPGAELPLVRNLAFSTTSFHFPRSWTQAIQFWIFNWQMSCLMLSSHLYLCLPCDILVRGFQLNIFLTILVSGILCKCVKQLAQKLCIK